MCNIVFFRITCPTVRAFLLVIASLDIACVLSVGPMRLLCFRKKSTWVIICEKKGLQGGDFDECVFLWLLCVLMPMEHVHRIDIGVDEIG